MENTLYEPPDLWCHASVLVDQDIIVFSDEKKCPYCDCPLQNYTMPEFKSDSEYTLFLPKLAFLSHMTEMTPICSCDLCLRKRRLLAPSNDISILVEAAHRPQFLFSNMFGVFFKEADKLKISLAK